MADYKSEKLCILLGFFLPLIYSVPNLAFEKLSYLSLTIYNALLEKQSSQGRSRRL